MSLQQSNGFVGLIVLLKIIASVQPRTVSTPMEEKDFQALRGVNSAGELNEENIKVRLLPHYDVDDFRQHKLSKRYILNDTQWRIYGLTYRIYSYPKRLEKDDVDAEVSRAFAMWSAHTDLTFTPTTSSYPHISIKFLRRRQDINNDFTEHTLNSAYLYRYGKDVNLGRIKMWSINSTEGVDIFQAAVHIFGHSLGLMHSNVQTAVMAPIYRSYNPNFKLDPDDIAAIHALYGKKNSKRPKLIEKPTHGNYSICEDPKIDALFIAPNGQLFAFKNDKSYKIGSESLSPKLISVEWPGLEANIDAAFTQKNKTYFFKDTRYWRYNEDRQLDEGYPREIRHDFPGIPNHLDAAMVCDRTKRICFFKDNKYFEFYEFFGLPMIFDKVISEREDLLSKLDAAVQFRNGYTFFFKNDKYYRVNFISEKIGKKDILETDTIKSLFHCKQLSSTTAVYDTSTEN